MEQVVSRPTLSISDIIGDYSLLSAVRIILANTRIPIVCTYVRLQSHLVPLEDGRSSNMRSIPISQSSTYNSLAYVRKWMSRRTIDVYTIHILKMPIYIAWHTFFNVFIKVIAVFSSVFFRRVMSKWLQIMVFSILLSFKVYLTLLVYFHRFYPDS